MSDVTPKEVIHQLETLQEKFKDAYYKMFSHDDHYPWHDKTVCCKKCYEGGIAEGMGKSWLLLRAELKDLRRKINFITDAEVNKLIINTGNN